MVHPFRCAIYGWGTGWGRIILPKGGVEEGPEAAEGSKGGNRGICTRKAAQAPASVIQAGSVAMVPSVTLTIYPLVPAVGHARAIPGQTAGAKGNGY